MKHEIILPNSYRSTKFFRLRIILFWLLLVFCFGALLTKWFIPPEITHVTGFILFVMVVLGVVVLAGFTLQIILSSRKKLHPRTHSNVFFGGILREYGNSNIPHDSGIRLTPTLDRFDRLIIDTRVASIFGGLTSKKRFKSKKSSVKLSEVKFR